MGNSVTNAMHVYETLQPRALAEGQVSGAFLAAALGGPSLDLRFLGQARLPGSSTEGCPSCANPDGETLQLAGDLQFASLRPGPDGSFTAQVSGDVTAARAGEEWLDVDALFGSPLVAAAGALGLGALLWGLKSAVGALLTRYTRDEALRHPKRRALVAHVRAHPGVAFRRLCRETGIPTGTARHHLAVLKRAGLLVEQRHRATLRYFLPDVPQQRRGSAILLAEPTLARLHDWVAGNPWSTQLGIVQASASWGWARSTTQHRLRRLVAGGLVAVQGPRQGRRFAVAAAGRAFQGQAQGEGQVNPVPAPAPA